MHRRALATVACFAALLAVVAAWRLVVGGAEIGLPEGPVLRFRLVRLASGVGAGMSLGVAGVLLQGLLRNPLAAPDLMGLSAGSGLAVTIAAYLAYRAGEGVAPAGGAASAAAIGSLAALGVVYLLSQRSWLIDPVAMILVGVAVSFVLGSLTVFVQHLMPDRGESGRRWLLGALRDDTPWRDIALVAGGAAAVVMASARLAPAMDAASLGEDEARATGVPLGALRAFQFVGAGVLTAGAVSLAGPLGFVGLIAPHVARLAGGPGHRGLIPAAGLLGAAIVVAADVLVKTVRPGGGHLPIGVLTSVVGGPLFIWLLLRERGGMRA